MTGSLHPRERRFERAGAARGGQRRPGACLRALFRLCRRRRDPRRQRPDLRRLQRRERRLPAGPVRRGQRDRRHGGGRRAGDRRGRGGRRAARCCARPAAAAASASPSSGARETPCILPARRTGSATTTTLGALLPMAFGPINLAPATAAARRGCGGGDPRRAPASGSRWSRSYWAPASAASPSASPSRW